MARELRLPSGVWGKIALQTARHLLVTVLASVCGCYVALEIFSQGIGTTGFIVSIVAPIFLGGPAMFYMSLKHHELESAYRELEHAAAHDSLTQCLNHGAFVDATTTRLARMGRTESAMLVVDADYFKSINDLYGHANGDIALKLIVSAIRSSVRPDAVVGRLGGEEFGIFLPDTDFEAARASASAICRTVSAIQFQVKNQRCSLSVSIGGAVCSDDPGFNRLFRTADERLYWVKANGRNNTDIAVIASRPEAEVSAPLQQTGLVYRGQPVARSA